MEAHVEAVLPLLELDLPPELDVRGLRAERTYPTDQPCARVPTGIEIYMRHATPRVVGRCLDGPDTHLSIEHDADLFEDATWIYVGGHSVPHGPHASDGLAVVLLRFLRTQDLHEQLVLAVDTHYVGDVELERGEISLVVAQVDTI